MTLMVGRNLERGTIYVHFFEHGVSGTFSLTEAQAIKLADELAVQVDALNLDRVLDEC